jgi:large subunit ribosomal protein L9
MKLILLRDVDKLGEEGEIVTVKDGYGRNFLIPQRLARVASDGAVRHQKEIQRQSSRKHAKVREDAEKVKAQLDNAQVVIAARTGEENRIFGTVTSQQVAVELNKQGFEIDRRDLELDEDIRMIGVYSATVKIFREISATVKIQVISESSGDAG